MGWTACWRCSAQTNNGGEVRADSELPADRKRLSEAEAEIVRHKLPDFIAARERFAADPSERWPGSLRVKGVEGAAGIFEVTFNFAGPDIRATFEWVEIEDKLGVSWRRIGGHKIFSQP